MAASSPVALFLPPGGGRGSTPKPTLPGRTFSARKELDTSAWRHAAEQGWSIHCMDDRLPSATNRYKTSRKLGPVFPKGYPSTCSSDQQPELRMLLICI